MKFLGHEIGKHEVGTTPDYLKPISPDAYPADGVTIQAEKASGKAVEQHGVETTQEAQSEDPVEPDHQLPPTTEA